MKKYNISYSGRCKLILAPSMLGMLIFYGIPFIRVIYNSFIENQFSGKFVGFKNYVEVLTNPYFELALKNSMLLIIIGVAMLVVSAFFISLALLKAPGYIQKLRVAFIIPMMIPTASVIYVWRQVFVNNESIVPVYSLYIWKNMGIAVILFTTAFSLLDNEVFEAAKLDGVSGIKLLYYITCPLMLPTIVFVNLISIVYSFRVFRETYQYYGSNYPADCAYSLQYYMNNHFIKLDYQYLATGAVITMLMISVIVWGSIVLQRRASY